MCHLVVSVARCAVHAITDTWLAFGGIVFLPHGKGESYLNLNQSTVTAAGLGDGRGNVFTENSVFRRVSY
jgi:hypothetical protein